MEDGGAVWERAQDASFSVLSPRAGRGGHGWRALVEWVPTKFRGVDKFQRVPGVFLFHSFARPLAPRRSWRGKRAGGFQKRVAGDCDWVETDRQLGFGEVTARVNQSTATLPEPQGFRLSPSAHQVQLPLGIFT